MLPRLAGVLGETEDIHHRRADGVVDDPAEPPKLVDVVEGGQP